MTIAEMHYDFKKKLDKVDSQQHRNLLVPEIDWALNEAQEVFAKRRLTQRGAGAMDDVRTLVVQGRSVAVSASLAAFPAGYWRFLGAEALMERPPCKAWGRVHLREPGSRHEENPYTRSSFGWREVSGALEEGGIRLYDDGTFANRDLRLTYLRRPVQMHFASGHGSGGYRMPGGTQLTGTRDCELPEHTHREIVDIAVLIASGEMHLPDYQVKKEKVSLTDG